MTSAVPSSFFIAKPGNTVTTTSSPTPCVPSMDVLSKTAPEAGQWKLYSSLAHDTSAFSSS